MVPMSEPSLPMEGLTSSRNGHQTTPNSPSSACFPTLTAGNCGSEVCKVDTESFPHPPPMSRRPPCLRLLLFSLPASPTRRIPTFTWMTLNTARRRNLTNHSAIDTSPALSPTGQQIAFISDRSGTPQLWTVDSDGSNLQRLVSEGGHCDSPDWSPDGRFILYSWQAPGHWKHDVYVIEVATEKIFQLTLGMGSHENPTWSPDGRHIVFQSTRTGSKQIFTMNADGKNLKQLTAYGKNESPAWSHYFKTEQPE